MKINSVFRITMFISLLVAGVLISAVNAQTKPLKDTSKASGYQISSTVDASFTRSGSKATGGLSGLYSTGSKKLAYMINFKNINPTSIEFRNDKGAVVGAINNFKRVKDSDAKYISPVKGEINLGVAAQTALINQKIRVHFISAQFPKGGISGQLSVKKQ